MHPLPVKSPICAVTALNGSSVRVPSGSSGPWWELPTLKAPWVPVLQEGCPLPRRPPSWRDRSKASSSMIRPRGPRCRTLPACTRRPRSSRADCPPQASLPCLCHRPRSSLSHRWWSRRCHSTCPWRPNSQMPQCTRHRPAELPLLCSPPSQPPTRWCLGGHRGRPLCWRPSHRYSVPRSVGGAWRGALVGWGVHCRHAFSEWFLLCFAAVGNSVVVIVLAQ